jgi:hypothetical protein
MTTRIKIKKGAGTPSGLTFGELAYDLTNKKLFIGITGGNALLANTDGGVATVNGATGSVTTYAGTTGNIQFRYGSGVTATNYFGLTVGNLGQITDILTLSGATVGFDAYFNGNNEALGLQFERGVYGLGMDEAGGVAISAKGIYDEGGPYLYGASLSLVTPSAVDSGSNIYFRAAGSEQFIISQTSILSNAPHLFGFGINSNSAAYTNSFEGPITGVTATFTGLLSASKGISASGATFSGNVNLQDNTLSRIELLDYCERFVDLGDFTNKGAQIPIDLSTGQVFRTKITTPCIGLSVTNTPDNGNANAVGFSLLFVGDGTARSMTWNIGSTAAAWAGGIAPTYTSTLNKIDVYSFLSRDGGSNWLGFVGGQNF